MNQLVNLLVVDFDSCSELFRILTFINKHHIMFDVKRVES